MILPNGIWFKANQVNNGVDLLFLDVYCILLVSKFLLLKIDHRKYCSLVESLKSFIEVITNHLIYLCNETLMILTCGVDSNRYLIL